MLNELIEKFMKQSQALVFQLNQLFLSLNQLYKYEILKQMNLEIFQNFCSKPNKPPRKFYNKILKSPFTLKLFY